MLVAFLDRVLALAFGLFLLAWPAPGEEADIDKSWKTIGFCGSQGIGAFLADAAKGKKCPAPVRGK